MTATSEVSTGRAASRRLIGRERQLTRLEALLEEAIAGHRVQTAFVEGEAGIGKTRTVEEFATRAVARGATVLIGQCVAEGESILPYAPLVEIFDDLVRRRGARAVIELAGPAAAELARLAPPLAEFVPVSEPTRASASRLFHAVRAVIDRLCAEAPVVVVVEDLHWADRSTRELFALLASQLRGGALLVFTVRDDESPNDAGVVRFIAETGRGSSHHVVLPPLTREEQARQVSDILGVPPRTALLDDVYARAEGNPFFAEELLVLGPDETMPATIRDLLLARLDALDPQTRQALRAACVIGRRIPHRLLDRVADVSGPALERAMRPAVEHHVLLTEGTGGGMYVFRHALLQEAIAGGLLPGEAARLHRRAAEALTESPLLAGDAGPSLAGRIALHWNAAGDGPRALVASVEAARVAAQALAFSESLSHYERAVSLIDTVPGADALLDEPRYRVLWSAAEVAHLAARPQRAAELIRLAIAAVDPAERHHHGTLHERLGRYLWMAAEGEEALAAYERAVELVPSEPISSWRAAVLSGYSQVLMLASRFEESLPLAREAVEIARNVPGARSIEGHARNNLGVDLAHFGRIDEGIEQLEMARRIADEEFVDVDDIARAIVNLHSVLFDAGRMAEAADVALDGIEVVEALGLAHRKGVWCRCDAAMALISLGRNAQVMRLLDEADALDPQGIDQVRLDLTRGTVLLRLGELEPARAHLDDARRSGARLLDGQLIGPLHAALVEVLSSQGDRDAALAVAREGREKLLDEEPAVFCVPLFAAAVSAAAARPTAAAHVDLDTMREWFELSELALRRSQAAAPVATALHHAAACELAEAEGRVNPGDWLAVASEWRRLEEPYREAQARIRAATGFLSGGGDRDAGAEQLRAARALAEEIGAQALRATAEDIARRARVALQRESLDADGADPYRLTRREREILALVAEGLTDRSIGSRLFISHRTVERHVSNLLAKLRAERRSELTAIAHRLGLTANAHPAPSRAPGT